MNKLFSSIRNVSFVLMIVIASLLASLSMIGYLDFSEDATWVITNVLLGFINLTFYVLIIIALVTKKNKVANVLITIAAGMAVFSVLTRDILSIGGFQYAEGLYTAIRLMLLIQFIPLLIGLILIVVGIFNEDLKEKFNEIIRISALAVVGIGVILFILYFIAEIKYNNFMGIFNDLTFTIVEPVLLLVVFANCFDLGAKEDKKELLHEEKEGNIE